MGKHKGSSPDLEDLQNAVEAFTKDLGLNARWSLRSGPTGRLRALVEVWNEVEGVKLGICRLEDNFGPHDKHHLGAVLGLLHRSYWLAEEKVYASENPQKLSRRR